MTCKVHVDHGRHPTEAFEVSTGVRQGCLLLPFLFLLTIDWIMKITTGFQWTQPDDLDVADDLA